MNISQFTKNSKYLMLALDHRGSMVQMMNPNSPESVKKEDVIELKRQIINVLKDQFSGALIDPEFGLLALRSIVANDKPYLLSIEKSGYIEDGGGRVTELEYNVSELKNMGAQGIKILLYFNPNDEKSSDKQLETAKKVLEDCNKNDLPLFLEIVTYSHIDVGAILESPVQKALTMFLANNIRPSVFKLEYPGNTEACQKITGLLGDIPWILLTKGGDYDQFKNNLQNAVKNGCRGFLAGRSIWQEVVGLIGSERQEFLRTVVKKRFEEISKIALENH